MKKIAVVLAIAMLALFTSGVAIRGAPAEAANEPGIAPGSAPPFYPGADNITVYLQCQPDGRVALTLNWVSYGFGAQFVDLSLFNNNWIFGTFIGQGPLPAYQNQFTWNGLTPNAQHYVRINTATQFGWQPSQTYVFTTSNCGYNPYPPYPQPGPCGVYGQPACPPPYPPQPYPPYNPCGPNNPAACQPTQCNGTPSFASFVPGNCPPVGACNQQTAQIAIYPPPASGCVWTQKGEGAAYALGETVTYCYYVNQPMWVHIVAVLPNGQQTEILPWVWDDGTGGCATYGNWAGFIPRPAGQPTGQRIAYFYGGQYSPGSQLDTTTFTVN